MTTASKEPISDDPRRALLSKVRGAVGLLIDDDAIEYGPAAGPCRFKQERFSTTGGPTRIGARLPLSIAMGEARAPRHTGVLVRGADGVPRIVTSAHCITVDEEWRKQVRLVVGVSGLRQTFPREQVVELGGIQHYEDMQERDLAVLLARIDGSQVGALSFPSPDLEIAVGDRVFVVGHAGGLDVDVYPGVVTSRVPLGEKGLLRGMNIEVKGARKCLSGSPVFVWPATEQGSKGPVLFGVLQGMKEIEVRANFESLLVARVRRIADEDHDEEERLLGQVRMGILFAELASRYGIDLVGLVAGGKEQLMKREAAERWSVHLGGVSIAYVVERFRELFRVLFPGDDVEKVIEVIRVEDDCIESPVNRRYNVVFLGGGMSIFFRQS